MRKKAMGAAAVLAAALVGTFQACGSRMSGANSGENNASTTKLSGNGDVYTGKILAIAVAIPPTQNLGSSYPLQVTGGRPPYVFKVVSGNASVGANGVVTASSAGASLIEVSDLSNQSAKVSIIFRDPASNSSFSDCTTPWGQVIPHGIEITAFAAAQVNCPATCQAKQVKCVDGQLDDPNAAALAGSCSVRSCTLQPESYTPEGPCNLPSPPIANSLQCTAQNIGQRFCTNMSMPTAQGMWWSAVILLCTPPDQNIGPAVENPFYDDPFGSQGN